MTYPSFSAARGGTARAVRAASGSTRGPLAAPLRPSARRRRAVRARSKIVWAAAAPTAPPTLDPVIPTLAFVAHYSLRHPMSHPPPIAEHPAGTLLDPHRPHFCVPNSPRPPTQPKTWAVGRVGPGARRFPSRLGGPRSASTCPSRRCHLLLVILHRIERPTTSGSTGRRALHNPIHHVPHPDHFRLKVFGEAFTR